MMGEDQDSYMNFGGWDTKANRTRDYGTERAERIKEGFMAPADMSDIEFLFSLYIVREVNIVMNQWFCVHNALLLWKTERKTPSSLMSVSEMIEVSHPRSLS